MKASACLAIFVVVFLATGSASAAPQAVAARIAVRPGSVYPDAKLSTYVSAIGGRLLAAAGAGAGGAWRFVVLDDPAANAFALPNRQVLVTRGMLALANNEAEVAAVLAHEIAHGIAGDAVAGARRGTASEMKADSLGLRLLAAAGYDPQAQPDLQASLVAAHGLDARLRGPAQPLSSRAYAPALDDRLRASVAAAARLDGGRRGRATHLAAIDGMTWGPRSAGLRIRLHRLAPGDDVLALASAMPVGNAPRARFDLLNGLRPGDTLKIGDVVKLVGR